MAYVGKITAGGSTSLVGSTLYGTCSTGASTAAKVAVIEGFDTLETGVTVHIKFTYSNTATTPTLSIKSSSSATSGTTAKNIYKYGTTKPGDTAATSWQAGSVVSFTYDGSYWMMNDHLDDTNTHVVASVNGKIGAVTLSASDVGALASTTKYAGASTAGGSATSAAKLDTTTAGSATQPCYFSSGVPSACTYELNKTVPSDAVFTDTDTKVTQTATSTNANYEVLFSNSANNTTETAGARKDSGLIFNPSKDALTVGSRKSGSTVGSSSIALGENITASSSYSHAEGYGTTASGSTSHAEGSGATASGLYSHAEGFHTTASGSQSHAEGQYTTANHQSQHVFGEYNIADPSTAEATARGNYIEIVGNGSSSASSNARTLDWDGNEILAGNLTLGGASSDIILSGTGNTWDGNHTSLKGALTPVVVSDSTVNLNNYTSSGKWILTGSISIKNNFPIAQPGCLEVTRWAESSTNHYCRQDFKRYDTTGGSQNDTFSRVGTSTNGGVNWSWGYWRSTAYFLPGETYTITNGTTVISYVTSSSTELNLGIWLPKSMKYTNGLSSKPSTVNLIVRGGNGQYLQASNSGYAFKWSDNFRIQPSHLKIKLKKSDGTAFSNCVNNDPYAAEFNGDVTITFS